MLFAQFNPYCIDLRYSAPLYKYLGFILDISIQICVPPNVLISFVDSFKVSDAGYYQSLAIQIIHNCFRQKPVHLRLSKTIFTFNTAFVVAARAVQTFKWSSV